MAARSIQELEAVWKNLEGVKRMSDRVVGVGPFGIGLDGLLTWVPWAGDLYTVGMGGWLLTQSVRAKAAPATVLRMAAYLAADTATAVVPFLGAVVDTLFPGHLMAAKALQKDIESTHWVEMSERDARDRGLFEQHSHEARAQKKRRVVYLGG
ncbi:DUF4112 domain-containing protein [Brevundimonas sp. 2R-24]|uniref:DUF4112 domain-containing protein n=1 Tax=Peiella sedimenti TaxID=3061083 RepID=A0ABT8SIK6_9CAUL|nr:DUF4112 domain-containing protein [Caulobacteraceae bacterium XZ-24]